MKSNFRLLSILLFCAATFVAQAQIDMQLSQYWAAPAYYNAGATGAGDKLNFMVGTRSVF